MNDDPSSDESYDSPMSSADERGAVPPLDTAPAPGADDKEVEFVGEGSKAWTVTLRCPTPLAVPVVYCKADDQQEAKALFNKANSITSTIHTYTITPYPF